MRKITENSTLKKAEILTVSGNILTSQKHEVLNVYHLKDGLGGDSSFQAGFEISGLAGVRICYMELICHDFEVLKA